MRVVGGSLRGRRLATPKSDAIRPTTDRARESLFNILEHGYPGSLEGVRVLDLFSGTGALGIEAISRGAAYCLFVEQDAAARALIRENVEALGLQGCTRIFRLDATNMGPLGTLQPFQMVFADPPYGKGLAEQAFASLIAGGWLAKDALVVVEEATATPFQPPEGLTLHERRDYASSTLCFCSVV